VCFAAKNKPSSIPSSLDMAAALPTIHPRINRAPHMARNVSSLAPTPKPSFADWGDRARH
jgi:hypothetical protein